MHPLGPQDLQPHELDGGHDGGEKQQNRHGIVDGKAGVALGPQHHEGAAHRHKAQKHAHEHDELQTACTGHQPPQLTGGGVGGHHAVHSGGQHIGDGHGEGQIVHVQLIGVIVYGAELRAVDPCGHQGTDTVVHLIHHHGDEHIEGKAHHALHEGEVVATEADGHPQTDETVEGLHHAADDGQHQTQDSDGRRVIPQQQQRDGDHGAQHRLGHGHQLQKQIPLVDIDIGLEHADGERQSRIDGHDPQQLGTQRQFLLCPLGTEHVLRMRRQCEAQHQQHQTQHRVGHKEHSVQFGHGPAVLRHLGLRVIPHIGAAQSHTQQQKICNDGAYGAVYAVFTGPQLPLHDGGIYQREDGAHCHGDIGEDRTRPHLIYLQKVISFRAVIPSAENMISVYYTVFVTPCKAPSFAHGGEASMKQLYRLLSSRRLPEEGFRHSEHSALDKDKKQGA